MTPQHGPTSKPPISINFIHEVVADFPDEMQLCALVSPVGIQIQLFYAEFELETALYAMGLETMEIIHVIYESISIPQHVDSQFLRSVCKNGIFDISGILYFSPESFLRINKKRALEGNTTFRYMESALLHTLNCGEFAEELRFTPNWSDTLTILPCFNTYAEFIQSLEEDFEIREYTVCTVKLIENLRTFADDQRQSFKPGEFPSYLLKSLILFGNDLTRRTARSCAETNIVAEVLINEEPSIVTIDAIEAEPNRYGRVRPVISSNEVTKYEYEFYTIELPTLDDLDKSGYQVGDVVEVTFINRIPKLGKIIRKTNKLTSSIDKSQCYSCGSKLVRKNGQLYCPKPNCASTVFYKTLHANSKRVLDLPFDWHTIHELVMQQGAIRDIPSIFNLDRTTLMHVLDTEMIDFVLKTLRTRIDQLNGRWFSREVQNNAQGKFLDALSITGLHSQNIKRLRKSLYNGDWEWTELPLVLTDRNTLRSYGIPSLDVTEIVNNAILRIEELDTLVREF